MIFGRGGARVMFSAGRVRLRVMKDELLAALEGSFMYPIVLAHGKANRCRQMTLT